MLPKITTGGALFSEDRTYRYRLWRQWGQKSTRASIFFICLNPSIADETRDDPTQRRLRGYASAWGYDGYIMGNIFAYISTDPKALKTVADPIGPENDMHLKTMQERSEMTVVAWGTWGKLLGRDAQVLDLLQRRNVFCFGVNKDGTPKHPLYLKAHLNPQRLNIALEEGHVIEHKIK